MAVITFTTWTTVRGDTPSWQVSATRNGQAVDLTGAMIVMSAKRSYADTVPLFTHSLTDGYIVVADPPAAGIFTVSLASTDTSSLTDVVATKLYVDVQITEASGIVTTPILGTLTVYPNVS